MYYYYYYYTIMKEEIMNECIIRLGQNAQENWDLVDSDPTFTWFHLNSYPSCHVVIDSIDPTIEELRYAANLCKSNTKYRNLVNLKICYTKCGNLKKGTAIGSVTYKSNRKVKYIVV